MALLPTALSPARMTVKEDQLAFADQPPGGKLSVRQVAAHLWRLRAEWPPMTRDEFAPIAGFLRGVGPQGVFQMTLPDRAVPRGVATGVPVVRNPTNLLLWSEALDNAAWAKAGATVAPNNAFVPDPDGTLFADQIIESSATSIHGISQTFTVADNDTVSVSAHGSIYTGTPRRWCAIRVQIKDGTIVDTWFDLIGGVVGVTGAGVTATIYKHPTGNWYRFSASLDVLAGGSGPQAWVVLADADGSLSYTGNGTAGLLFWGAQVEVAASPGNYLATTDTAITTPQPQSGNTLPTTGWTPNVIGILKADDLLGFDNHAKVYALTADANSDAWGNATLSIGPNLRATPSDGEVLTVNNVPFSVYIPKRVREYEVSPPSLYAYAADMVEAP